MSARLVPLTEPDDLDELLRRSADRAVILYNHDPWCPISAWAEREVRRLPNEIVVVDVSTAHALVDAIEARTGVRHESPQVIVLRDSRPVWHASHMDISAEAIERALGQSVAG